MKTEAATEEWKMEFELNSDPWDEKHQDHVNL